MLNALTTNEDFFKQNTASYGVMSFELIKLPFKISNFDKTHL